MVEKSPEDDKCGHRQPECGQPGHGQPDHGQPDHGQRGQGASRGDSTAKGPPANAPHKVLPRWGSVVQAGAFGAILGGVTTGVTEWARVRKGETTTEAAVETVVRSSAQTAATTAVASVAGHAVRTSPLFGVLALAAAGLGALLVLGNAQTKRPQPSSARRKTTSASASDPATRRPPAAEADPGGQSRA